MPTPHPGSHLFIAAGLVAVTGGAIFIVRNRVIRRRLLFSLIAAAVAVLVHVLAAMQPQSWLFGAHGAELEQLITFVALANAAVSLLFNPWYRDGDSDRAPSIVQDSLVIAASAGAAALLFRVSSFNFLTGSAIVAAVVGFALQDTLGNAFAGIAIQVERPFKVGHWIAVGDWSGLVTEVSWRSTKIRTKAGNVVAVPNSVMANHAITNYSEPTAPTRIQIEVGAAYGVAPNDVRSALLSAVSEAAHVLASPLPDVLVADFGASAITYRIRFWVDNFSLDESAKDAVRTRVYYELRRRNIEIPWPIQVQYAREERTAEPSERRAGFAEAIARVPVLSRLPADAHRALAASARELIFAGGEVIVRESAPAGSMFVVLQGRVAVTVGTERREVAVTEAGGYFGEMSLLTGEPRTATVVARGDCTLLEMGADAFRSFVQARPEVIDDLALGAAARRKELDEARAASAGAATATTAATLRARMREFFGLS